MVTDFDPTAGVDCETPIQQSDKGHWNLFNSGFTHIILKKIATYTIMINSQNVYTELETCKHTQLLKLTSRFLTSSLTLATVSEDCLPLVASFISVDKKFLHFFTFSIVSYKKRKVIELTQCSFTLQQLKLLLHLYLGCIQMFRLRFNSMSLVSVGDIRGFPLWKQIFHLGLHLEISNSILPYLIRSVYRPF